VNNFLHLFFKTQTKVKIFIFLAIGLFLIYGQTLRYDFVHFDDDVYVSQNKHIQQSFSINSIFWAFQFYASNWHPLTWLSHMFDYQLFGLNPAGHHLTNLILHLMNSMLLFLVFEKLTGAFWKSVLIASLFAFHPINVESVAWIAERKNVLSTFWGLWAIWAYSDFVKKQKSFSWVILFFSLSLMAKSMLVTLPFLLLLLDFWPLRRLSFSFNSSKNTNTLLELIREKWILFLLTFCACILTYKAQQTGGSITNFPLSLTLKNSAISYISYFGKALWPTKLSVFYPLNNLSLWQVIFPVIWLICITILSIRFAKKIPYLTVGWFWYLGALIPVIGLVQLGGQAMADRYAYVPFIGLFIIFSWGISDLAEKKQINKNWIALGAIGVFLFLLTICSAQVKHWQNTITLFEQAQKAVNDNDVAHLKLGLEYNKEGKLNKAMFHFSEVIRINPNFQTARLGLASLLIRQGMFEEGLNHFSVITPFILQDEKVNSNFPSNIFFKERKNLDEALKNFYSFLESFPKTKFPDYHHGINMLKKKKTEEAMAYFQKAIEKKPKFNTSSDQMKLALKALAKLEIRAKLLMQHLKNGGKDGSIYYQLTDIIIIKEKLTENLIDFARSTASYSEAN
jgi:protein O-mannosyl-transferase